MINLEETAIIKYYEKENKFKDITDQIIYFKELNGKYEITYKNYKTYFEYIYKFKILKNPEVINISKHGLLYKGKELKDIRKILKFENWIRVFYKDGLIKTYDKKDMSTYSKSKELIKVYMEYIIEVRKYIDDKTDMDFLTKQLSNLSILKDSVLFNVISNEAIIKRENDKDIIYPFSYNEAQKNAIKEALGNNISLIQGPPGTGKTQTILNIIANLLYQNKTIAVIAANNEATKNVEEKLEKVNLSFLTAFLGKKDNVEEFFNKDKNIPDECNKWKDIKVNYQDNYRLKQLVKDEKKELEYNKEISILKQELYELEVEKKVNDTSFETTNEEVIYKISKIICIKKILDLKARLETSKIQKVNKIFNRISIFIRHKIYFTKEQLKDVNGIINALDKRYYEYKSNIIKRQIIIKEAFINSREEIKTQEEICKVSLNLLLDTVVKNYMKEFNLTIDDYRENFEEFTSRFPIVFSTTNAIASTSGEDYLYDYIIIDEASQVDLTTATIALSRAKNLILVGDLMQLPNIVKSSDVKDLKDIFDNYNLPDYFEYTQNSILKSLESMYKDKISNTLLNEHYRCDPQIIGFCNKRFYDNKLIIKTEHKPGMGVKVRYTPESHHARNTINEREIDIIQREIIPNLDDKDIGIVTPYRDQVKLLNSRFKDNNYLIDTVHKFQGKEKDCIIMSTVANEIKISNDETMIHFLNNPNLINVAISRAKNSLYLVMSKKLMEQNNTLLSDFVRYIKYYGDEKNIEATKIYSVLDLMFNEYSPILEKYKKKMLKISKFDSENIIGAVIKEICDERKYGSLWFYSHYQLQKLVKASSVTDNDDKKFLLNPNTHCDFVIYNKLDKQPVLVVEVDGMQHEETIQKNRDIRKDRILKSAGIPILRIRTTSSNCKERIEEIIHSVS